MTAHPIDTEALRATAEATIEEHGPLAWPDIPSADLLALLDELHTAKDHLRQAMIELRGEGQWSKTLEHRATRAEAQSAIRGRAVAIYRERAREAEAERDEWRQTALDERAAALDALEQLKLRDAQIKAAQHALTHRPEETP